MTLKDAKVGSTVVVSRIDGEGAYKRRIMRNLYPQSCAVRRSGGDHHTGI